MALQRRKARKQRKLYLPRRGKQLAMPVIILLHLLDVSFSDKKVKGKKSSKKAKSPKKSDKAKKKPKHFKEEEEEAEEAEEEIEMPVPTKAARKAAPPIKQGKKGAKKRAAEPDRGRTSSRKLVISYAEIFDSEDDEPKRKRKK
jgi:hypothetical protein